MGCSHLGVVVSFSLQQWQFENSSNLCSGPIYLFHLYHQVSLMTLYNIPLPLYSAYLLWIKEEEKVTAKALRTQVLHLAETIGGIFASCRSDRTWLCDSPNSTASEVLREKHIYHPVRDICNAFINELLAGTNSCCFWIEEENSSGDSEGVEYECTVVFDEDRFLQIKNLRSKALFPSLFQDKATHPLMNDNTEHRVAEHDATHSLAISLDYFALVTETFLRGQGMSSFISSQDKESMAFW